MEAPEGEARVGAYFCSNNSKVAGIRDDVHGPLPLRAVAPRPHCATAAAIGAAAEQALIIGRVLQMGARYTARPHS